MSLIGMKGETTEHGHARRADGRNPGHQSESQGSREPSRPAASTTELSKEPSVPVAANLVTSDPLSNTDPLLAQASTLCTSGCARWGRMLLSSQERP